MSVCSAIHIGFDLHIIGLRVFAKTENDTSAIK